MAVWYRVEGPSPTHQNIYETHLTPCYDQNNESSPSDMSALGPVARHQAAKVSEVGLQAGVPWPLLV